MTLSFTDEQIQRSQDVLAFASGQLGADLGDNDRRGSFPRDDWQRCGDFGLIGCHVPSEFGGRGLDTVNTVVSLEAMGRGCRDNGLSLAIGGQTWSVQEPIVVYGSEDQKRRFLPKLASGEWIGCHAVTEMDSGSDALSLKTTARAMDGGFILNGRKSYIGMAPVADLSLVLASTDPAAGRWGVSAFLVESDRPGVKRCEARAKTGTRTNLLGDLIFEDCFVPAENQLGKDGIGMSLFTRTIAWERAFIHAGHLGSMAAVLETCIDYARKRKQFGQPIGKFQSVSNRIADMRLRIETSRLLMYEVAGRKDRGEEAALECAMAKLHIGEALLACATDAVRIHGACGVLEEYGIERELETPWAE